MVTSSTPGCYAREPDSRQADLILQDGVFYLLLVVGLPLIEAEGVLGIVLGVKNIVSDSMGETFSGAELNRIRHRYLRLCHKLQKKGTKSARHLLKKRRKKEQRFARDVNYQISKEDR
jgi:putative transposase